MNGEAGRSKAVTVVVPQLPTSEHGASIAQTCCEHEMVSKTPLLKLKIMAALSLRSFDSYTI